MVAFFEKITEVLNQNNIPYMLSGSVAMSLYIVPRATRDFDFIVSLKPDNVEGFVEEYNLIILGKKYLLYLPKGSTA